MVWDKAALSRAEPRHKSWWIIAEPLWRQAIKRSCAHVYAISVFRYARFQPWCVPPFSCCSFRSVYTCARVQFRMSCENPTTEPDALMPSM